MAGHQYYSEEILVEKMEHGQYGWFDYVNHFPPEWQEEYTRYCKEYGLVVDNGSAVESVHYKDEQLEVAMKSRNAQQKPF